MLQLKDDKQFLTNLTTFVKADAKLLPDFLDECLFNPALLTAARSKWSNEVGTLVGKLKGYTNLRLKIKTDLGAKTAEFLDDFSLAATHSLTDLNKVENLDLVDFWKIEGASIKELQYNAPPFKDIDTEVLPTLTDPEDIAMVNYIKNAEIQDFGNSPVVVVGKHPNLIDNEGRYFQQLNETAKTESGNPPIATPKYFGQIANLHPYLKSDIKYLNFIRDDALNNGKIFKKLYNSTLSEDQLYSKVRNAGRAGTHAEVLIVDNMIKKLFDKGITITPTQVAKIKIFVKNSKSSQSMCRCPHCFYILKNKIQMIGND